MGQQLSFAISMELREAFLTSPCWKVSVRSSWGDFPITHGLLSSQIRPWALSLTSLARLACQCVHDPYLTVGSRESERDCFQRNQTFACDQFESHWLFSLLSLAVSDVMLLNFYTFYIVGCFYSFAPAAK